MGYRKGKTMSNKPELIIPSYPWAVPTKEQKLMFDALSYEEQLKMLQDAITEGIKSGISDKSFDEIIEEARTELKAKPTKK